MHHSDVLRFRRIAESLSFENCQDPTNPQIMTKIDNQIAEMSFDIQLSYYLDSHSIALILKHLKYDKVNRPAHCYLQIPVTCN